MNTSLWCSGAQRFHVWNIDRSLLPKRWWSRKGPVVCSRSPLFKLPGLETGSTRSKPRSKHICQKLSPNLKSQKILHIKVHHAQCRIISTWCKYWNILPMVVGIPLRPLREWNTSLSRHWLGRWRKESTLIPWSRNSLMWLVKVRGASHIDSLSSQSAWWFCRKSSPNGLNFSLWKSDIFPRFGIHLR